MCRGGYKAPCIVPGCANFVDCRDYSWCDAHEESLRDDDESPPLVAVEAAEPSVEQLQADNEALRQKLAGHNQALDALRVAITEADRLRLVVAKVTAIAEQYHAMNLHMHMPVVGGLVQNLRAVLAEVTPQPAPSAVSAHTKEGQQ